MAVNPGHDYVLGVSSSVLGQGWAWRDGDERIARRIGREQGLEEVLCRIMAARGVAPEAVSDHLNPTLRRLMPEPEAVRDLLAGAERLVQAVRQGETIGIIGDYDVDGMSSCALLMKYLHGCGSRPKVHIPSRSDEGYGPSPETVRRFRDQGVSLLVTLDCGIAAHEALAVASQAGLDVIIADHHPPGGTLPEACAVIDPARHDDESGLEDLCAAGVTFMLIATCSRLLRQQGWWNDERREPDLLAWLDLVALATVCDLSPLRGLNRAFVVQGLKVMARRGNHGLSALADMAQAQRPPDVQMLGFALGPRLNAAGRIGRAETGLALLMAENRAEALSLAQQLEQLNAKRRALEADMVAQACAELEASPGVPGSRELIVAHDRNWSPGMVGLVAARLKERFQRPSLALCNVDGDKAVGSGRSVAGVDLGAAVRAALDAGLLIKGGGHAMAAGLTVRVDDIAALRAFLSDTLARNAAHSASPAIGIDGSLGLSALTPQFLDLLERAGPYGRGNPAPVFVFPMQKVAYARAVGAGHVTCAVTDEAGNRVQAIAFRALDTPLGDLLLEEREHRIHIAGSPVMDSWAGRRKAQIIIQDAACVGSGISGN